jgi:photosystem II stability/assembly factor-like uncharacterized protein
MVKKERAPGWRTDPIDNRDDLEKRAERYREVLGVEDLDALTDQLLTLRRARRKDGPRPRRAYDAGGSLPKSGLEVVPLDPDERLAVAPSRRPRRALASWGLAGRCVKVTSAAPFGFARIRFALPAKRLGHLYPGTIVAARWDPNLGRFRLIPASGYSETGEYVYAQITRPGIFTAVGLPRDPRLLLSLRLLATLAPWTRATIEGGAPIAQPMFEALLKQRLIRQIVENGKLLEGFGYRQSDFPARLEDLNFTGGALDFVLNKLPELDLLDVLDDPNRMIKPVPDLRLPDEWPLPRGRWESLGPVNLTGRIKTLAIHPEDGDVLYAGAAGGGVWKTTNGGHDWHPTMHDERSLAIGGLALAPSNPDVLYAATGEWTGHDDHPKTPSGMGGGVYRTTDGARNWHLCGPIDSYLCTCVAVHPSDPDRVLVGGNRGLHRSRDGGITWQTVAPGGDTRSAPVGPVSSVILAPDAPDRVFAGVHQQGVYRSTDGGDSWRLLTMEANGIPSGEAANAPKIALGRDGSRGSNFVAVKMDDWIYASADGGERFTQIGEMPDRSSSMIPWCNLIAVHPGDDDILLAGGTNLHRSDDGGRTWTKVGGYGTAVHEDQQFIVFHPADKKRIYLANDGGVWASNDGGIEWRTVSRGLVAAQAYDIGVSDGPALRYGASLHDFSAHIFDGKEDWISLGWGESGSIDFVPGRSDEVYADSQWSNLMRFRRNVGSGWETVEDGPDTALHASQSIAISAKHPYEMLAIDVDSRSLLRRPEAQSMDWPVALELPDAEFTSVAIAPSDHRHAYAGDSEGRLWRSVDAGTTWANIWRSPNRGDQITHIAACRWDAHRFYICAGDTKRSTMYRGEVAGDACSLFRLNDFDPAQIRHTHNGNRYAAILESKFEDSLLALGGTCLAYSFDGGWSWDAAKNNLPKTRMMAGTVREADWSCFLATHGAGVFKRSL